MSKKFYSIFVIVITLFILLSVVILNRSVDPIGVYSNSDKKFLEIENRAYPDYISLKMFADDYEYGIIGSSRSQKIDHLLLKKFGYEAKNLSISASSIKINESIFNALKKNNKNIILFLDVYTLASNNYDTNFKKRHKLQILENESNKMIESKYYREFKYLLSKDTTIGSFNTIKNWYKNKERDEYWLNEAKNKSYKVGEAKKYLSIDYFPNYKIDFDLVKNIANVFTKRDFIIIPPSYYEIYYLMYKKGILEEYFKSIEILLNSDAEIISFLTPSSFLTQVDVYEDGVHFKNKYGSLVVEEIFSENKKNSVLLTKENFEKFKIELYNWFEETGSLDESNN